MEVARIWVILLLICVAYVAGSTPSLTPFSATTSLYTSYYGNGDCFQQPATNDTLLIAPTTNTFDFNMCGMCYKVTGPNGKSVVVRVFDSCSPSDCPDQWTLNGFPNVGPYYTIGCPPGTCDITLQVTECQVQNLYGGKVAFWFDDWDNPYAFGVVPVNILVRVETLYINYTAGQKIDCASDDRTTGNLPNFACPGNPNYIQFPYTLTLCSYSGECHSETFTQEYTKQMVVTNFQFTNGYTSGTTAATTITVATSATTATTSKPTTTSTSTHATTTTSTHATSTSTSTHATTATTTTAKPTTTTTTTHATSTTTSTTSASTTGSKPTQTLYNGTSSPSIDSDTGSVNLGLKFTVNVAGHVTGIQVYRGAGVSITTGALWSSSGTNLASITFSPSSSSTAGWIKETFSTPVAVTANTLYHLILHARRKIRCYKQWIYSN